MLAGDKKVSGFRVSAKRTFDIGFSLLMILALAVPAVIVAVAVRASSRGPVLYWSQRVGAFNVLFRMPKFRTMRADTPAVATHLLSHPEKYLTPVGSFLRRTSLDELPQLWSILVGDMSFVGPRPALFNQRDLVELRSQYGLEVLLPGLTGWAQINGRDELDIPTKVGLDAQYRDRQSILFDLKILWLTILKVLCGHGISH
jgi:O-antigen biosynthesis protein WbqP